MKFINKRASGFTRNRIKTGAFLKPGQMSTDLPYNKMGESDDDLTDDEVKTIKDEIAKLDRKIIDARGYEGMRIRPWKVKEFSDLINQKVMLQRKLKNRPVVAESILSHYTDAIKSIID